MKHQLATTTKSSQNQFSQNKAQCKVVINTTQNDSTAVYQSPYENPVYQERSADIIEQPNAKNDEFSPNIEFFKHLSTVLSDILRENTAKTFINIFDGSGKIIVDAVDLVMLISEITGREADKVSIVYNTNEETGCFAKVNPIKRIRNIKIDSIDFQLSFNREYNILTDVYGISLSKCIII